MATPRFIQIHSLVSYPAVLLNRDDAGLAKRISYGGAVRTRISSQCLKRRWRTADDDWGLDKTGLDLSVRSREIFEYELRPAILRDHPGIDQAALDEAGRALSRAIYGDKADDVKKRQALLLGWPELEFLKAELVKLLTEHPTKDAVAEAAKTHFKAKEGKANFAAMRAQAGSLAAGLEAALFGRMVTSDPAANTDAAIHVAHAFTVHAQESETDYFTVVDDLKSRDPDEDSGSAGIFDTELTSGLFYEYIVVDVPTLVANITGKPATDWDKSDTDRALPAKVVEHLLHLIATISPGAKKGSTAPYAHASALLVEAGSRQPRALAKAFEKPIITQKGNSQSGAAIAALFDWMGKFDGMYGRKEIRRYAALDPVDVKELPRLSLDDLGVWVRDVIEKAEA